MLATNELLLKTRKGATAAFGVKEWETVLIELGFRVTIAKTGRTVTQVVIAKDLNSLTIVKEPHYKRVTFYTLSKWLRDTNQDLVALASAKLGMDTPEVEKKLKDLYVRDLTNTGTCPVCEGNFKRNGTGLVHHGYTRPGDGMQHGDCFAVGYLPWELSPQGAEDYLKELEMGLVFQKKVLANLPTTESLVTQVRKYDEFGNKKLQVVVVPREADEFPALLKVEISKTESLIRRLESDITYFTNKIAKWAPDELPEVKHAGKFQKAN